MSSVIGTDLFMTPNLANLGMARHGRMELFATFVGMDINDLRAKIDGLTDELIALLNKRASYAEKIGEIKRQQGLPVFDASREQSVLDCVSEKARAAGGPLTPDSIKKIFSVIMEETRKVEE